MKVLTVSGFLGAGKTTFIKTLVNKTGRDIAIYENEYAAEGVDKKVLEDAITNGDVNIFETSSGCICCSEKGDFKASVLTIANSIDPEILIVEPTGVGRLSNVINNLKELEYDRIQILKPVTIADAGTVEQYIRSGDELYADQLSEASVIILSKQENMDENELAHIEKLIRELNPDAEIIKSHYSSFDTDWFNTLFEKPYDESQAPAKSAEASDAPLPESFSLEGISAPSLAHFICFAEDLVRGEFGCCLRAKGYVNVGDELLHFEVSGGRYFIEGVSADEKPVAVFIGYGLKRQALRRKLFRQIKPDAGYFMKPGASKLYAKRRAAVE